MDDSFVLLAAWRRTDSKLSVVDRLGETYAEAAVSVTITSLTNFISFWIGAITPFPSVRIFCIYTATAVLFTYIYQVTFFGGCMAISGIAEKRRLHAMFCVPTMPKSLAGQYISFSLKGITMIYCLVVNRHAQLRMPVGSASTEFCNFFNS